MSEAPWPPSVVDVHWHHVPRSFVDAVLNGACRIDGEVERSGDATTFHLSAGFRQDLPAELTDIGLALGALDRAGVDVAAASVAPPLSHSTAEPEVALEVSRFLNDGFAELAASSGGRIVPLANVPLQDVDLATKELRRVVGVHGFRGVAIGSNVGQTNLGDDSLLRFWEEVSDMDLFVFVHGLSPLGRERMREHELQNFVGLPIDTAVTVASMVFGGVFDRLPDLKVCFSHGGGAFPCLVGRWDHGYTARLRPKGATSIRLPSDYLESIYCDSLTHDPAALRFLVERVGAGHVLLGSDHPFDMGEPDPAGKVREALEDEGAVGAILGRTASRLLGLEPPERARQATEAS